jgi:hypothetical protein
VFDHSKFGITLQNTSNRTVEIDSVALTSVGNAAPSGLGDIKGYWRYPQGNNRLGPGERVYFDKQWGFVVDTGHRHVRYVFHVCWRGVGADQRQCRTQWVDTLPYIPNPVANAYSEPELRDTSVGGFTILAAVSPICSERPCQEDRSGTKS